MKYHRSILYVTALLTAAFLAAGCISDRREPDPAEQAASATATVETVIAELSLAGTGWVYEYLGEPADDLTALPDTRSTVNFFFDRYSGAGGCNWYLGVYSADETTVRMNIPSQSRIICVDPPGVMEQEATFMSALVNTTEYKMEGENLVLYTVQDQRLLTFSPAQPVPLDGTLWSLKFFLAGERLTDVIPGSTITAQIEGDQFSGSAGCNDYSGTVTLTDDGAMSVGPLAVTAKACAEPSGVMDQESAYLEALGNVAGYEKAGGVLHLLNEEGSPILFFGAN